MDKVNQDPPDDRLVVKSGLLNNIPDCAFLKLSGEATSMGHFDLNATIIFAEYSPEVGPGSLRFSIRRADLRFRMGGCSMPCENREIQNELAPSIERQREVTVSTVDKNEDESGSTLGIKISKFKGSGKGERNNKRKTSSEKNAAVKDTFNFLRGQVTAGGSEESPHWTFHVLAGDSHLAGALTNQFWGTIILKVVPAFIEARLDVRSRDIDVIGSEGLWPTDMSKKKTAVFRILALRHFKSRCKPYLSMAKICIENSICAS